MPRKSVRQISIESIFKDFDSFLELLDSESDNESDIEEALDTVVDSSWDIYVEPIPPVPKGSDCLIHLLAKYDDVRFKQELRVSRENFQIILKLIEDHPVFHTQKELQQFPIPVQLALTLYRLGHYGSSTAIYKVARQFAMGDGSTVHRVTDRVIEAVMSLGDKFIRWPTSEERLEIRNETERTLPKCIGFIDGCQIPLEEKPLHDPESYFNRNKRYAIQMQCIVNSKKQILNVFVKYPGSVHDARVFASSSIGQSITKYLSEGEWICGDSAYKNTNYVIVPFRSNSTFGTVTGRKKFNRRLSKHRVCVEHVFGMVKEIFGSLKGLRMRVDKSEGHLRACKWISSCCILYNIIRESISKEEWSFIELQDFPESDSSEYPFPGDDLNDGRANLYALFNS